MERIKLTVTSLFVLFINACNSQSSPASPSAVSAKPAEIICGAERLADLIPLLQNKNVALVVNQTSLVGETHLLDTLLSCRVTIKKVFSPEHGFRGGADAGEHVNDSVDAKTKIRIASLYGAKKKPSNAELKDVDVVIFDVQDVGARFYTYISTLHYLMEACAENDKELIVLDRPNPNGWYVDGPVLKKDFQSFVGMDPVPVVHGLTVGEYAQMLNGEKWLSNAVQCKLKVITCHNYDHTMHYKLPVKPSPNLPNETAVYNYPSICFFEGTDVSVGRGTYAPFQAVGSPDITIKDFSFTPKSLPGAKMPPHINRECYGFDLRKVSLTVPGIQLSYLLKAYAAFNNKGKFFLPNNFFDKLAGTDELRKQIIAGKTEAEIKASWKAELDAYKAMRKKYLLYKDFE